MEERNHGQPVQRTPVRAGTPHAGPQGQAPAVVCRRSPATSPTSPPAAQRRRLARGREGRGDEPGRRAKRLPGAAAATSERKRREGGGEQGRRCQCPAQRRRLARLGGREGEGGGRRGRRGVAASPSDAAPVRAGTPGRPAAAGPSACSAQRRRLARGSVLVASIRRRNPERRVGGEEEGH